MSRSFAETQSQGSMSMSFPTSSASTSLKPSLGSLLLLECPESMNQADLVTFVQEHDSTLNFPKKLMLMLTHVDNERSRGRVVDCISWTRDGHAFIIRNRKDFVESLLPLFFRGAKFSSFTRKLYRWGFRQICIPKGVNKKERDMVFGHEHFQRDGKALISNMRSVTAAGTRRAIAAMSSRKKARTAAESQSLKTFETKMNTITPSPIPVNTKGLAPATVQIQDASKYPISLHPLKSDLIHFMNKQMPGHDSMSKVARPPATSSGLEGLLMTPPPMRAPPMMRPPIDNSLFSLPSISVLQNQLNHLKAIARSNRGVAPSAPPSMASQSFTNSFAGSSSAGKHLFCLEGLQQLSAAFASQRNPSVPSAIPNTASLRPPQDFQSFANVSGFGAQLGASVPNTISQ